MKIGQQSTVESQYLCSLIVLETACQECPLEHLGLPLFDERIVPIEEEFADWDDCLGSSTSEANWYVDIFPKPVAANKVCVANRSNSSEQIYECVSYAEYDPEIHEIIHGPYLEQECNAQCPPADPFVFEPRCIPISIYDANIHEIYGGPYQSVDLCGTGFGSSSSSSSSGVPRPTCEPTIRIITLPDGSVAVTADCPEEKISSSSVSQSDPSSSSQSESDPQQGSSSPCSLGASPETQFEFCSDGTLRFTTYFVPNFKDCYWSPLVQPGQECPTSSSSCDQNKRYCLYTNFAPNQLSVIFSQEDKPPPCTYKNYCLPYGCQSLCETDSLGTPIEFCVPNCCGSGMCDVNCDSYSYANCIVCAMVGGRWFFQGEGWEAWYLANCGCLGDSYCPEGECCVDRECVPCDTDTDTDTDTETSCGGPCKWQPVWVSGGG
jgi:hypothetical protein